MNKKLAISKTKEKPVKKSPVKRKLYTKEDMIKAFRAGRSWTYDLALGRSSGSNTYYSFEEWFKQYYNE